MMPCTISGSVPYVGGHSDASSTPSRPEVPGADVEQAAAGAKGLLRPARSRAAIGSRCVATASATVAVFGVDEINDLERRREVDLGGARIPPLGQARVEERHVAAKFTRLVRPSSNSRDRADGVAPSGTRHYARVSPTVGCCWCGQAFGTGALVIRRIAFAALIAASPPRSGRRSVAADRAGSPRDPTTGSGCRTATWMA